MNAREAWTARAAHGERRQRLIQAMGKGVAIVPTATEKHRNSDSHYPYRFDSYFYYLTGFPEPEAVLVMVAGDTPKALLFCREKDPEREVWNGFRYGPEAACREFGLDECHPIGKLEEMLPDLLADQPAVFYPIGADSEWDGRVLAALNAVRAKVRTGVAAPREIVEIRSLIDEMRLIKGPEELELMRKAAAIAGRAHVRAMRFAQPGLAEYEVEAEILHEFRRHGAQAPAYTSIVAGGANACVLHYVENNAILRDGDLLLIDAGCELDGYASDITRTFPVNGTFSPVQREVYELVLAAQEAAIDAVKPGNPFDAYHEAALQVLVQGMIDFGLLPGSADENIESGAYKQFYMHRTGHWLGLDVHDVGDYKRGSEWRALKPGMMLTVEPGLYIRPADNVPTRFHNIGVRIEDDVLVTDSGNEILTDSAPKTVAAIEDTMKAARG